jgi:hypothetical protein
MGQLVKMTGLQIAERVYIELKELLHRRCYDQFDTPNIRVYGFCNNGCTGYHFASESGRSCTVINNPVTDQIRIVYGSATDFDAATNLAKDTAQQVDLRPELNDRAAEIIREWLGYGDFPAIF